MPQSLGSLFVELKAETAGFVSALSKAAYTAQKASRDMSREFRDLGSVASQTFGAFGDFNPVISKLSFALQSAGSAASSAMKEFGKLGGAIGPLAGLSAGAAVGLVTLGVAAAGVAVETAKSADEMLHLAESSGVSVEALSRLSFVGKQYDIDQEQITKGLQMMAVQMVKAATSGPGVVTVFDRLQLSVRKNKTELKDAGTMFDEIIARLQTMKDRTAAVGFARQIFGRQTGAAVLRIDTSGLDEWSKVADKIGATISTEMAESSHEFETSLNVIDGAAHGLANRLTADLLPALNAVAHNMAEASESGQTSFGKDFLWTIEQVVKGITALGELTLVQFEQIGIGIKYIGASALTMISGLFDAGRAAMHGDVFGFNAAVRQGLSGMGTEFDSFLAESKGKWTKYGDFVKEVWSKPAAGKSKTSPGPGGDADLTKPTMIGLAEKDTVAGLLAQLSKQAADELELATATEKSAAASLLAKAARDAENKISETRIQLMDREKMVRSELANAIAEQHPGQAKSYQEELDQIHGFLAALERNTPRIKSLQAEIASGEFAEKAGTQLDDFTSKTDRQTEALRQMAAAYTQGPAAVRRAQEAAKIAPFEETRADVGEAIAGLKKFQDAEAAAAAAPGVGAQFPLTTSFHIAQLQTAYDNLGPAIDRAKISVAAFTSAEIAEKIAKERESLAGEAEAYKLVGAAALSSAAAQREAAARAEAVKFGAANPAVSKAQLNEVYETALGKLGEQRDQTIAQEAAQYDLNASYAQELEKLKEIKGFLESSGESTLAIDTKIYEARISHLLDYRTQVFEAQNAELLGNQKIYDASRQQTEQWDKAALTVGSLGEKFRAMVNEIELAGAGLGEKVFGTLKQGVDDVSSSLAKFIVTGKSGFASLLNSMAEELVKAQLQWSFAKIFQGFGGGPKTGGGPQLTGPGGTPGIVPGPLGLGGALAGVFGLGGKPGTGAPTGSSGSPFYVIISDSAGNPFGIGNALPISSDSGSRSGGLFGAWSNGKGDAKSGGSAGAANPLGSIGSELSKVFESLGSSLSKMMSSLIGSLGGLMKGIGGLFGGFLAEGGPVSRGVPIVVGEKQAEVFVPNEAGTIIPSLSAFTNSTRTRAMAARFAAMHLTGREYGGAVMAGHSYLTGEARPEVFLADSARSGSAMGSGAGHTTVNFTVNGVQDHDSFARSKGQIYADLQQQIALAHYRNRGGF